MHIYKKALAISRPTQRQRQRAAAGDTNGQRKPSTTGQGARNDTPRFTCGSEGGGATSDQEDWDGPRRVSMQRSDLDLYESRSRYYFWPERTPSSPRLLAKDIPAQQVADMNLWGGPPRAIPRLQTSLSVVASGGQPPHRGYDSECEADRRCRLCVRRSLGADAVSHLS